MKRRSRGIEKQAKKGEKQEEVQEWRRRKRRSIGTGKQATEEEKQEEVEEGRRRKRRCIGRGGGGEGDNAGDYTLGLTPRCVD